MKPSTQDAVKGKAHEIKGSVKETAGRITNDPDLEDEGTVEKFGGKIQKGVGKVEKALGA